MANYNVTSKGKVPKFIMEILSKYTGMHANQNSVSCLDSDIDFIVRDTKEAHGNMSGDYNAWLISLDGYSWSLNVTIDN